MITKTIKYNDFEGNEITEDFNFHLTKADLVKFEVAYPEGTSERLSRAIAEKDSKTLIEILELLVRMAYGVRVDGGRKFRKSPEALQDFLDSEAYSELFLSLLNNENALSDFFKGLVPNDMREVMDNPEMIAKVKAAIEAAK